MTSPPYAAYSPHGVFLPQGGVAGVEHRVPHEYMERGGEMKVEGEELSVPGTDESDTGMVCSI